ncbi:MAG: DUF115 domain-containing protein [Lentisphaeraceae bacterium]|nr:DUF115 domain-containing protein [Lentisphaeraceae bacterium]
MKLESKHKYWKFLPVGGKNIEQYVYQENGQRARFTENPDDPRGEISRFIDSNPDFSLLLMPPTSIECLRCASEYFDEVIIIDYNELRLNLFQEVSKGEFKTLLIKDEMDLRDHLSTHINKLSFGKVASFIPSRYARLDHKLRCLLKEELLKIQQEYCSFAVNRSLKSWHRTLNALENIKNIDEAIISLPNIHGKDAVIVGAGPSLDETVNKLSIYQDKYYVIATDGSLKTLLRNEIIPDFIVSCEDTVMSWQFFTGYLDKLTGVPLVAPFNANHYLLKNYPGPVCLSKEKVNEDWTENILNKLPEVNSGRCVGHMAYNLAIAIGAGRIIMTGFDLAFKGEVFHPKDMAIPYFHEMELPVPVTVTSIFGGEIRTDLSMKTYLKDFEYMIRKSGQDTIDATEGGALILGSKLKALDELTYNGTKSLLEFKIDKTGLKERFDSKRRKDVSFFESMASCFTSYLVQNSDQVNNAEKQADRNSAFALLEALLIEKESRNEHVEALLLPENYSKSDSWFLWALEKNVKLIKIGDLSALLHQVKAADIDHLYCINGQVPPDLMALTDIECTDIKTSELKTEYERSLWLKKYSILTSSSLYAFWDSMTPEHINVFEHESIKLIEKVANGN